jgi:hypothetical protein
MAGIAIIDTPLSRAILQYSIENAVIARSA